MGSLPANLFLSCLLNFFKLTCLIPAGSITDLFFSKKSAYCSLSNSNSFGEITFVLISSRKHLVVASTSAVALCASANGSLNKNSCNSVKVGSLNFPPLPPGILHNCAVFSVQVSKTGSSNKLLSTFNLWNSQPMILRSNFMF